MQVSILQARRVEGWTWRRALSRAFPKLRCALVTSLRSLLMASRRSLTGFCSLVISMLIRWWSASAVERWRRQLLSKSSDEDSRQRNRTRSNLLPSCYQMLDNLVDIFNSSREIRPSHPCQFILQRTKWRDNVIVGASHGRWRECFGSEAMWDYRMKSIIELERKLSGRERERKDNSALWMGSPRSC